MTGHLVQGLETLGELLSLVVGSFVRPGEIIRDIVEARHGHQGDRSRLYGQAWTL